MANTYPTVPPQFQPPPQPPQPQGQPQWFQAPDGSWHPVMVPTPPPAPQKNKAVNVMAGLLAFIVIIAVIGVFVAAFTSV